MALSPLGKKGELYRSLVIAALYCGGYALWIVLFKLITLTLMTYFVISPETRLQDITEVYTSNEIIIAGFGALAFILLVRALFPLLPDRFSDFFDSKTVARFFGSGFFRGAVLALGILTAFLFSGHHHYLGFLIHLSDPFLAVLGALLRILALVFMVYCEEYLFRRKIQTLLKGVYPEPYAIFLTALLYCSVKYIQFDLGTMHLLTLFLMSSILGFYFHQRGEIVYGSGFWMAVLILFHPFFGLPIFGSEFPGLVFVKYLGAEGLRSGLLARLGVSTDPRTALFLTGGMGGPLSSFALQILLGVHLLWLFIQAWRKHKIVLNPFAKPIE